VSKGTRLVIVVGIIVAIAAAGAIVAVSAPSLQTHTPQESSINTIFKPRQIEVNLNENLTVKAK